MSGVDNNSGDDMRAERDLTDEEKSLLSETIDRIAAIKAQIEEVLG